MRNEELWARFDNGADRTNTNCVKWDGRERIFGNADAVPLWVADTEFPAPQEVLDALAARVAQGTFGYSNGDGADKQEAANWLRRRHGVADASADWMVFSPGVVDALYLAVMALTEENDLVAIQPPIYGPFSMVVKKANRRIYENKLIQQEDGSWKMDLADLEEGLKKGVKLVLLCNPHNPVGRVWTYEELSDLVALLNRYGAKLASDEIHGDLVYEGVQQVPICTVPGAEKAVMAIAPSKTFNLAGLQYSFFVIKDPEMREIMRKQINKTGISSGNTMGELAATMAYRHGDAWLDTCLEYLAENKRFVFEYFARYMPDVRITPSEGTYLLWIDFSCLGLKGADLKSLFVRNGVIFSSGTDFGEEFVTWMRMNIGTTKRILTAGLENIKKAYDEAKNS